MPNFASDSPASNFLSRTTSPWQSVREIQTEATYAWGLGRWGMGAWGIGEGAEATTVRPFLSQSTSRWVSDAPSAPFLSES